MLKYMIFRGHGDMVTWVAQWLPPERLFRGREVSVTGTGDGDRRLIDWGCRKETMVYGGGD